jgi:hypothetical protein
VKPVEYFSGEKVTYNVFQSNGYYGAIDHSKFWNGKFAEDFDNFKKPEVDAIVMDWSAESMARRGIELKL